MYTIFTEALDKALNESSTGGSAGPNYESLQNLSVGEGGKGVNPKPGKVTAAEVKELILEKTNNKNKVYGSVAEMKRSKVKSEYVQNERHPVKSFHFYFSR